MSLRPARPVLTRHSLEGDVLRLWGRDDVLEVSAPLEGVLRLRHAPGARHSTLGFPALPEKRSFAVTHEGHLPLDVTSSEEGWRVSAGGLRLDVDAASGLWSVTDAGGHELARATGLTSDLASELRRSTLSLDAPAGAAYLGFGEKVGPLDKRGMRFTFWNTDHFPHHTDSDPLYASFPLCTVIHEGRAAGLFLDETWRSEVDVANLDDRTLTWRSAGPTMDLYVTAGPSPVTVLERYTALTGRHPMPPLWALGYAQSRWGYENETDVRAVVDGYRSRGIPLDAVYVDVDYLDGYRVFTWDRDRYPDPRGLLSEMLARGVRLVPIVDPGVKADPGYDVYDSGLAGDHFVKTWRGETFVGEVWPKPAVFPDFTRDEVVAWWALHFERWASVGVHGVWNDMNEPSCFDFPGRTSGFESVNASAAKVEGKTLPYDARHGTRRHIEVHNAYALGMNEAARVALSRAHPGRRPFMISRAGYAGLQRYSGMWSGDNSSEWSHLALSLPMLMGMGLSGMALVGADVGGFNGDTTGELLVRWTQTGAFYPVMRNHAVLGSRSQEPWRFGEEVEAAVREAVELRYRLLPTLYSLMREATLTGLPPLRPLALHHADDADAVREDGAFLFGPDMLVAPVLRQGARRRVTYLPAGRWAEVFNLSAGAAVHAGAA
ncbi:glycoside hydrolase family 31 protein, partial [Deinococcus pimensis]|uniref:glycoside hydrolase family 31 protein n=1 Tax=Deinococcus pimensis TaxID=309888 RepID=UPI0012F820EF